MTTKANIYKVVTSVVRSSHMYLNKLEEDDKGTKKCRSQFIIPKKDKRTIAKIEKAIEAASQKKFGKKALKNSKAFGYPLRDGDKEAKEGSLPESMNPKDVKGCYFVNSSAFKLPQLVDADNEKVEDIEDREAMLLSGFYFKVSLTFKGYDNESKGVRAELNNVMFVKEGDRLDGGMDAENEDWGDEGDPDDENDGGNGGDFTPEKIKELCAELKEEDEDALKEVLSEYDCKTARQAAKLEDDELQECGEALQEAIDDL